jgi:hypothetical protein
VLQNLLRKSLYFNYDHYKKLGKHEFINEEPILRPHISTWPWPLFEHGVLTRTQLTVSMPFVKS